MDRTYTIYSLFFLVTALVSLFGAILAWRKSEIKGATELGWLMFSSGFGAFWIVLETSSITVAEKILWAKLEYVGGIFSPALFLTFVLRFTEKDKFLSTRYLLLYFLPPLATLALLLINKTQHLVWSGFSPICTDTRIMEYYHGPAFWIGYILTSYLMMLFGTVQIMAFLLKRKGYYRNQSIIILAGVLMPWVASILYLSGINVTPGLDLAPASIALSGILLIYAISYTKFLNLVPVARETLVENMPDGILALDKQGRILDVNKAALRYLGISDTKVHGLNILSAGASVNPILEAVIDDKSSSQVELENEGVIRTFRIVKQPFKNSPGSRLAIIHDITDQIAQKREMIAAEERYYKLYSLFRLMSDNMPDMLWAKDLNKNYTFVNKAICEELLLAKNTDEPIGKTLTYFLDRIRAGLSDKPEWHTMGMSSRDTDQDIIDSGMPLHYFETGYINGKFFYFDFRKAPIFDDKGVMIGIVGSGRDVTIQKKIEVDIHKRDILLEAIARSTAILLKNEDIDGSIAKVLEILGNATDVNRVYIFKNHYSQNDKILITSQIYEWTNGAVASQLNNPALQNLSYDVIPEWFDLLSNGNVVAKIVKDMSGNEKELLERQEVKSALAAPIFSDGQFWGFIGFDDCMNQKEWLPSEKQILAAAASTIGSAYFRKNNRDELIKAKECAEQSDRLKSSFLANMSHEIRTPMNGIIGFTELLKEPKLTGEEQQEYIKIIEKSGERMLNIINDIIKISKLESGMIQPQVSEVDINEMFDYIYKFFLPQAEEKGLEFFINNAQSERDSLINTDMEKLYAILTNLTRNAIKFTKKGFIEVGVSLKDGYYIFYVKDTGIGMTKEQTEIIFDRFRQGSESISRNYEGSGLGLSISKAYVELLGGKIWTESTLGEGSIFYFTIKG